MHAARILWIVGHSTLPADAFVALLCAAGIGMVADVRRWPASRRHPQFHAATLADTLHAAGIGYAHPPDLGGRRAPRRDPTNTLWRTAGFRGYADYMDTPAYAQAEAGLVATAGQARTTVLCAEALWWQCHRGLIADSLKSQGWQVLHLRASGAPEPHPYTRAARIADGRLTYAPEAAGQGALF